MIIDNELLFSNAQAPGNIGTTVSTNVHDTAPLGTPSGVPTANAGRDLGQGEAIWLNVVVNVTLVGATATVDFRFRTDSNPNLTTAPVDLVTSGPIAVATLVAGYTFRVRIPSAAYKRYIGAVMVVATANITAGTVSISLVKDIQGNTKYTVGYTLDV